MYKNILNKKIIKKKLNKSYKLGEIYIQFYYFWSQSNAHDN